VLLQELALLAVGAHVLHRRAERLGHRCRHVASLADRLEHGAELAVARREIGSGLTRDPRLVLAGKRAFLQQGVIGSALRARALRPLDVRWHRRYTTFKPNASDALPRVQPALAKHGCQQLGEPATTF